MLFKNKSKKKIAIVLKGERLVVAPNETIDGPSHLKYYSGLVCMEEHDNPYKKIIVNKSNALGENLEEVDRVLHELETHDFSKPYDKSNYKKSDKKKNFAIITLSHTKEQFVDFLYDLRMQDTDQTFEIIWLRNSQNEFKSPSEALNFGMSIANAEYYALTHQDIRCNPKWISNLRDHFDYFDKSSIRYAFLGVAGTSKNGQSQAAEYGVIYLSNDASELGPNIQKGTTFADLNRKRWGRYKEVQTLDECAMFCRADLGIRYDEKTFDHYHWYGADICLQALDKGYKNFAIDADCEHLSDGQKNLAKEEHAKSYIHHGSRFFKKWQNKFTYVRSTTASFYMKEGYWNPLIMMAVNAKYNTKHPLKVIVK